MYLQMYVNNIYVCILLLKHPILHLICDVLYIWGQIKFLLLLLLRRAATGNCPDRLGWVTVRLTTAITCDTDR